MKIFGIHSNYITYNNKQINTFYDIKQPIIFTKADSSLLKTGKPFFVPDFMGQIDYEAEVVVKISRLGKNIPKQFAHRYYNAVTIGIDFTAVDIKKCLIKNRLPWDLAKGFDGAAVIGDWIDIDMFKDIQTIHFMLKNNNKIVLQSCTSNMIFNVDQIIAHISKFFTLKTGDIIFTGSPVESVPINIGDHLEGFLEDRSVLSLNCK